MNTNPRRLFQKHVRVFGCNVSGRTNQCKQKRLVLQYFAQTLNPERKIQRCNSPKVIICYNLKLFEKFRRQRFEISSWVRPAKFKLIEGFKIYKSKLQTIVAFLIKGKQHTPLTPGYFPPGPKLTSNFLFIPIPRLTKFAVPPGITSTTASSFQPYSPLQASMLRLYRHWLKLPAQLPSPKNEVLNDITLIKVTVNNEMIVQFVDSV